MMYKQIGLRETYDKHHEHRLYQYSLRKKRRLLMLNRLKANGVLIRAKADKHRKDALIAQATELLGKHGSLILRGVCDDTHRYIFALATRCSGHVTGNYTQMYIDAYTLYGIKGWYDVRRTRIREQGLGGNYPYPAYRRSHALKGVPSCS